MTDKGGSKHINSLEDQWLLYVPLSKTLKKFYILPTKYIKYSVPYSKQTAFIFPHHNKLLFL